VTLSFSAYKVNFQVIPCSSVCSVIVVPSIGTIAGIVIPVVIEMTSFHTPATGCQQFRSPSAQSPPPSPIHPSWTTTIQSTMLRSRLSPFISSISTQSLLRQSTSKLQFHTTTSPLKPSIQKLTLVRSPKQIYRHHVLQLSRVFSTTTPLKETKPSIVQLTHPR
jgi:hypothetical protein